MIGRPDASTGDREYISDAAVKFVHIQTGGPRTEAGLILLDVARPVLLRAELGRPDTVGLDLHLLQRAPIEELEGHADDEITGADDVEDGAGEYGQRREDLGIGRSDLGLDV